MCIEHSSLPEEFWKLVWHPEQTKGLVIGEPSYVSSQILFLCYQIFIYFSSVKVPSLWLSTSIRTSVWDQREYHVLAGGASWRLTWPRPPYSQRIYEVLVYFASPLITSNSRIRVHPWILQDYPERTMCNHVYCFSCILHRLTVIAG